MRSKKIRDYTLREEESGINCFLKVFVRLRRTKTFKMQFLFRNPNSY